MSKIPTVWSDSLHDKPLKIMTKLRTLHRGVSTSRLTRRPLPLVCLSLTEHRAFPPLQAPQDVSISQLLLMVNFFPSTGDAPLQGLHAIPVAQQLLLEVPVQSNYDSDEKVKRKERCRISNAQSSLFMYGQP